MRVTLLGAGVPTPTARRFGSSYLVEAKDHRVLIDCGPATTHKLARCGYSPAEIPVLLFTHHHFDHNADYPCFVLTRWDQNLDQEPLRVYGPPPTVAMTRALFEAPDGAYVCDWNARVEFPGSKRVFANRGGKQPRTAPEVLAADIDPTFVLEEEGMRIQAARTMHVQPHMESVAYRVNCDNASVVFTGDTELVDTVVDLAHGADMIVSMCWNTQAAMDANGEHRGQLGASTAAMLAARAGVRTLVLSHLSPYLDSPAGRAEAFQEAASQFSGEVIFAEELETLEIGARESPTLQRSIQQF